MIWRNLDSLEHYQEILKDSESSETAFGVFKHSTRCGISAMVKRRFEKDWPDSAPFPIYYLDLLKYREISAQVEKSTGVVHQSPQFIVISNGDVAYHASHSSIDANEAIGSVRNS